MTKAIKIFNKMVFNKFQGYADQGQVFKDDLWYELTPTWKYRNSKIDSFKMSGKHIYQSLWGQSDIERFEDTNLKSPEFEQYIVDNLILNHLRD